MTTANLAHLSGFHLKLMMGSVSSVGLGFDLQFIETFLVGLRLSHCKEIGFTWYSMCFMGGSESQAQYLWIPEILT